MIVLYKDPQCKRVVVNIKEEEVSGTASGSATIDSSSNGHNVYVLQRRIKELELCVESQKKQLKNYVDREESVKEIIL